MAAWTYSANMTGTLFLMRFILSGKTTLIKCIDRIMKPKGSIFLDERDIEAMDRQDIARYIGYVPQSSSSVLSTTGFDTILMGMRPHMGWRVAEEDIERVVETMELLHFETPYVVPVRSLNGDKVPG